MNLLSLTFHTPEKLISEWESYVSDTLGEMIENLMDVEKYIISEVESNMIGEGRNTNILLIFPDGEKRKDFIEIEMVNIAEIIDAKFGQDVMLFPTSLNPVISKF